MIGSFYLEKTDEVWAYTLAYDHLSGGNCVEVAYLPGDHIGVRDSKDFNSPVLRFPADEWRAFLCEIKNGEFDKPV